MPSSQQLWLRMPKKRIPKQHAKKPAPFSLRLSADERARLIAEAKGAPLGAYIKAKVFLITDNPQPTSRADKALAGF